MYDVIIIGAGPSGLFAANELANSKKVAIIDAGVDLTDKKCTIETDKKQCTFCPPVCHIMGGFGGAQFFEGTKLSIFPAGSGFVNFAGGVSNAKNQYAYVDSILERHGKQPRPEPDQEAVDALKASFARQGIDMKYYNSQKVSKSTMNQIALSLKQELLDKGVDILLREQVLDVAKNPDGTFKITTSKGQYLAKNTIFAVGRLGSRQLTKFADKLGMQYENEDHEIELGVRVEMPYQVFDKVNNVHNDLKLKKQIGADEELRTFCQDYKGFITKCVYNMKGDKIISSLDGHIVGTDEEGGRLSPVTNLAVHHRYKVNQDIGEIYETINGINVRKKPIVQSLRNFMNNSNEPNHFANPLSMPDVAEGNINDFLPQRSSEAIKEFIRQIDKVLPGFANGGNTVYAPSFEMGWKKFNISEDFETTVPGAYIIGDVTGHFRGAMQAMASGVLCGKRMLEKEEGVINL